VIAPGDGVGPLRWYECTGNPESAKDWVGHDLLDREMIHGHSLQINDMTAMVTWISLLLKWPNGRRERRSRTTREPRPGFFWRRTRPVPENNFRHRIGFHEARVADLNGTARFDVLDKPYNWEAPRVDVWIQVREALTNLQRSIVVKEGNHKPLLNAALLAAGCRLRPRVNA
jgi:hypothetical protein